MNALHAAVLYGVFQSRSVLIAYRIDFILYQSLRDALLISTRCNHQGSLFGVVNHSCFLNEMVSAISKSTITSDH